MADAWNTANGWNTANSWGNTDGWGSSSQGVGNSRMIPQHMHIKQIATKDTTIADKDATIAKQKDTLTAQELTIKRLTADNNALKAAHELEMEKLKHNDNLIFHELTTKRLTADIEALKAAHEEEIENLRQRWEKEANQCRKCLKDGHETCQYHTRSGAQGCWGAVKFER